MSFFAAWLVLSLINVVAFTALNYLERRKDQFFKLTVRDFLFYIALTFCPVINFLTAIASICFLYNELKDTVIVGPKK